VKTVERISGSQARQWKRVTDGLRPGKAFMVENHGAVEAVIVHPSDFEPGGSFDAEEFFARVRQSPPAPPPDFSRGDEL
jgi:hypothetical protein